MEEVIIFLSIHVHRATGKELIKGSVNFYLIIHKY